MSEERKALIEAVIREKGPQGVNSLSRELNIPLTTLQKYMHRQTYFQINDNRKWDLPEKVTSDIRTNSLNILVSNVESTLLLLKTQIEESAHTAQMMLNPINTLKKGIVLPVADKGPNIHPRLQQLDTNVIKTQEVFKKYVRVCPEEYRDLLKNLDIHLITIEKGTLYMNGEFLSEISPLFLEQSDTLSEEMVSLLKKYQKEA